MLDAADGFGMGMTVSVISVTVVGGSGSSAASGATFPTTDESLLFHGSDMGLGDGTPRQVSP